MWTSTLDLSPKRVILTNLLGRFWRGAYFSSFAPLRVENAPRQPLPNTGWVRVRNKLAGICGSDLHMVYADGDLRVAPAALPAHAMTYLGHEVVGEVIEIGDDVRKLKVGDRVALQHSFNCLSSGVQPLCRFCAAGNYNLCERGSLPGPHPIGGGWSEEMLLHEQQLFRVPNDMSDTQAVLLEPSAVALHAVLRHVPQPRDRVLIIGAGTIGLLTLQIVRALAPQAKISVQARYPYQVEKATRMGAAHIIYPQDSYAGVQQATHASLYKGILGNQTLLGGYDVIYDTIGSQNTLHDSLRWARAQSTVVLIGLNLHLMHIDLTPVWYQQINLIGTIGHGMETWPLDSQLQRSTFNIVSDMMMHGVLQPEQLVTHHFALNNYRQALLTAMDKREQRAIKVVFDYSMLPASVVPNVRASARRPRHATIADKTTPTPLSQPDREPVAFVPTPLVVPDLPVTPVTTSSATQHEEISSVESNSGQQEQYEPIKQPQDMQIDQDTQQSMRIVEEQQPHELARSESNVVETAPENSILEQDYHSYDEPGHDEEAYTVASTASPVEEEQAQNATLLYNNAPSPLSTEAESTTFSVHEPAHGNFHEEVTEPTKQVVQASSAVPVETQFANEEEPLNEMEWLDVMQADQHTTPEMEYVPDLAADAEQTDSSFEEPAMDSWFEQEPSRENDTTSQGYRAEQEEYSFSDQDGVDSADDLDNSADDNEFSDAQSTEDTRRPSINSSSASKLTKAVGRYRSKNKNKGRSTTGGLRS